MGGGHVDMCVAAYRAAPTRTDRNWPTVSTSSPPVECGLLSSDGIFHCSAVGKPSAISAALNKRCTWGPGHRLGISGYASSLRRRVLSGDNDEGDANMSTMRRRSRDPSMPADVGKDEPTPRRITKSTTTTFLVFIFLSTLLLALYLLSAWTPVSIIGPSRKAGHDHHDRFGLKPEHHVHRDASNFTHHWRITSAYRRADGVLKRIYLVNDLFPGPTLEIRSGDSLTIHVENALEDEGVSIHWHGLSMREANAMDGAAGITQDPIKPGETFIYDFVIDANQHGTFWWHAHDGVQRADGLYGGLVVHQPAIEDMRKELDSEHLLLIGDWYHRSAEEALKFYMHPGAFGLETVPDSILVNGRGAYTCTDAVPAHPVDCVQVEHNAFTTLHLEADRRNVLRLVNVGAYTGLSVTLPGALLTPLRVDGGHAVQGAASRTVGFLHPGERVDLLVEPDVSYRVERLRLIVTLDEQPFKYQNPALTLSHEYTVSWKGETSKKDTTEAVYELGDVQELRSSDSQDFILPEKADHTIILYSVTQKLASLENEPHGFINHTVWAPQSPALIGLDRDQWNKNQFVPHINYDSGSPLWVDIVLNNLDEDWHPFHLHGYDFWLLSKYSSDYNWGSYNPFEDESPPGGEYNLVNPIKKDTVYVPRRGYAVLRFRADNPGLWMFHCHVLWHQASGMAMAFDVR